MKIAFLGMGAMGERMAAKLAEGGHTLAVWNRTRARAEEAAPKGASIAGTPAEAAADAEIVFSMVRDDEAMRDVWMTKESGALAGVRDGAIVAECSTSTPEAMAGWAAAARQAGARPVGAPLSGSRPQAEAASLVFFAGGEAADIAAIEPLLLLMGKTVCPLPDPATAAMVKLAVNALYGVQIAACGELTALFERAGMDRAAAVAAMRASPVTSPAAGLALEAMASREHPPLFPIDLVAKDFGYALRQLSENGIDSDVIAAGERAFAGASADGLDDANITGIVERYRWQPTS